MIAGTLEYNISIYKPVVEEGKYGPGKTVYVPYIRKTRARVINNKGARQQENNEVIYDYTITFCIRSYHKIDEYMRIKYNGRFYRILNIIPPERRINQIQIDAQLINE